MTAPVRLWSDEPSPIDLLAFGAVAETAVEAVLDDSLDPVALGVSGPWGSGKSTVLELIAADLKARTALQADQQILVVRTDPWRYDPAVGAKATLIAEVLDTLQQELERRGGASQDAESALRKLAKRVNWMKALKLAAKTSITLQLPSLQSLSDLVSDDSTDNGDGTGRSVAEFRDEFAELMDDAALAHVRRVVVLVDDLDRCLSETVIETLETMRLFLSVRKMSFVIAADEERVADALRERYPKGQASVDTEEPAQLYLHKIVQTTLRLPALSRFDTEAFLLLLLVQKRPEDPIQPEPFESILAGCTALRIAAGNLDQLTVPDGIDIAEELRFAARLTPMLYERLQGSPRRVKRFLNDLNVRSSIASRRGIELNIAVVAKLMILELLMPDSFKKVLGWLARGELRQKLSDLERKAGVAVVAARIDAEPESSNGEAVDVATTDAVKQAPEDDFDDAFVRWAKLPPPLADIDLSPYLHLAASFAGKPLIDEGLPERLRDIASSLLSTSRIDQKAVTDDDLRGLSPEDATLLIEHLGRMARDRPVEMRSGVSGILRLTELNPNTLATAEKALRRIPVGDLRPPVILLFHGSPATQFGSVLDDWAQRSDNAQVSAAVAQVRPNGSA